jgi:hypothetical protein
MKGLAIGLALEKMRGGLRCVDTEKRNSGRHVLSTLVRTYY